MIASKKTKTPRAAAPGRQDQIRSGLFPADVEDRNERNTTFLFNVPIFPAPNFPAVIDDEFQEPDDDRSHLTTNLRARLPLRQGRRTRRVSLSAIDARLQRTSHGTAPKGAHANRLVHAVALLLDEACTRVCACVCTAARESI